jgi:hypothetical protein
MDAIDAYAGKWTAYNNKINTDWATYKTKNEVEVKRLAAVAEWTKEKEKATAIETAYKDGDLKTAETNETNDLATMTAAKKKVES